jgi:hypothetical protein
MKNIIYIFFISLSLLTYCISCDKDTDNSNQSGNNNIDNNGNNNGGTTYLSAPTNVSAEKNGSSIIISWNSVSGATNYQVYYSQSVSGTYSSFNTSTSSTQFTDNYPYSGDNYYKVKAINSSNESDFSSYAYCDYTSGGGGGTESAPSAPTGVTATQMGSTAMPNISISWNAVSNATSYKIYRSSSVNGSYSQITTSYYTSVSDYNPLNGNNYYKVKAVNSVGESNYSSYALYNYNANAYSPCPPNVTLTKQGAGVKITWSFPSSSGCGLPTNITIKHKYYNSATSYASEYSVVTTSTNASGSYVDYNFVMLGASVTNYYNVMGTNDNGSGNKTETIQIN